MTMPPRLVPDRPTPDLLARLRCLGTLLQQLNAQTACAAVNEAIEALQDAAAPADLTIAHPSRGVVDELPALPEPTRRAVDAGAFNVEVSGYTADQMREYARAAQAAALPADQCGCGGTGFIGQRLPNGDYEPNTWLCTKHARGAALPAVPESLLNNLRGAYAQIGDALGLCNTMIAAAPAQEAQING